MDAERTNETIKTLNAMLEFLDFFALEGGGDVTVQTLRAAIRRTRDHYDSLEDEE